MSGVYIPMEMPTSCMLCSFCVEEADPANGEMCLVTGKLMPPCNHERLDDCPLVPVPEHGRLGDLDALKAKAIERSERLGEMVNVLDKVITAYDISTAPTIIPADKEGEE